MSEIAENIRQIVAEIIEVSPETVEFDSSLAELISIDSVVLLEILVQIERTYDVEIGEADARLITNLHGLVDLVAEKVNKK